MKSENKHHMKVRNEFPSIALYTEKYEKKK